MKTRFAPSPTGFLHVGNARTALITWLAARKAGGEFLLRIDDTDTARSRAEYEVDIKDSLTWLGLDWDETANQKDRIDRYNELTQVLKDTGRLYPCYETPEELSLKRKTQLSRGKPPIYDRTALDLTKEHIEKYKAEGRRPHWRFKLDHAPISWHDAVRGEVRFEGADLSDPVVIRADGSYLYILCSVYDDIDFNITMVTRGEDHVSNTATHIQMFEALGAAPPDFAHLPLIADKDGGKLSKRIGSLSIRDLRTKSGLEPMAIVSLLARLGTSDPIEPFGDIAHVIQSFDFSKFSRGTPKFDDNELARLNAKILHDMPFDQAKLQLDKAGLHDLDEGFWNAVRGNLSKFDDIKDWWFVAHGAVEPVVEDREFIDTAAGLLPPAPWTKDTWGHWTAAIKAKTGRKGKQLFMPLRQALTGMTHGPELPDLLLLIGPEKTKQRLR
jgi:glutamyl-tRNA synthetase